MGTLYHNGLFYTMKSEGDTTEAVYVRNGLIIDIGRKEDLYENYKGQIDTVRDLKGAFVYPGFVDSHLHMIGHGEKLIQLDLSDISSAEEMKVILKKKVAQTEKGNWIIGEGWNENNFPDRKIFHREELDVLSPDCPMMLKRVCRHAVLANSLALELAGITKETKEPEGGVIVRDDQGIPTGYLLDEAQELVKQVVPNVTENYLKKALTMSVDDMYKVGLVGGHTEDLGYYGQFEKPLNSFQRVIDGEKRKFRAHLLVHHTVVQDFHKKGYQLGDLTPFIEFGAMKIFADGAFGGRTALLSKPYNDSPNTSGVAIHSREELQKLVSLARSYKMAVAIHTIGDLALEFAIETIENNKPTGILRDRLIHVQVLRDDLIHRLKKLDVVLDIQPRFVATDFPWVEERLGSERLPLSFAWKTMLENKLHCAGGSDAPIEPVNPLLGIHAAVTRKKPGEKHPGYLPEQKISVFEAVKLFTVGSAYAIGKENLRGLINPGFVADFTVLDNDLFKIEPDDILNTKVTQTIVDDTIMFEVD